MEDGRRRGFHGELLTVALMAAMGGSSASWCRQGRRSAMWHRGVESEGAEVLPQSKRAGRVKGEGAGWSGARPALVCGAALRRATSTRGARRGQEGGGVAW